MQNEERSKLEERIIAYFDGSLDSDGSRSLLREVAENPEKRSLFKAHETLSRLIAAAREPMEAPLEVKRSIAEKIPGMLAFIPSLFGAVETAPILSENTNPFIAFFARMSLSTAVTIGGAVAVLVTSGILIKNSVDQSDLKASASAAAGSVQNAAPANPTNSANVYAESMNSARSNVATRRIERSGSSGTPHEFAKVNELKELPKIGGAGNMVQIASDRGQGSDQEQNENSREDAPLIASVTEPLPSSTIAPAGGDLIPNASTIPLSALPIVASEGVAVRTFASAGERFVYLNGVGKPGKFQPTPSELLGMEFDLGDRYMFRVQLGQSGFAALANQPQGKIGSQELIATNVVAVQKLWSTVGMSYSFANVTSAPIIISGDVGAVWFSTPAMMARAGIATQISLFGNLAMRPSLTYDWVYTASLPSETQDGIYQNPITQSSMWSSSLGFNLGFVFQY